MRTIELAKKILEEQKYQLAGESEDHIAFRYQMNTIHLWGYTDEENFCFMTMPKLADATSENMDEIKDICYKVSAEIRQAKLYVIDDMVLATAEIYYLAEEDLKFQIKTALKNLVTAKVMFRKQVTHETLS